MRLLVYENVFPLLFNLLGHDSKFVFYLDGPFFSPNSLLNSIKKMKKEKKINDKLK